MYSIKEIYFTQQGEGFYTGRNAVFLRFSGCNLWTGLEKDRNETDMTDIPATYVPARNTVILSMALAWAETLGAIDIFIGVNSLDYSGYPDCRPEFIESFERTANLATKAGVNGNRFKIHTPLIDLTKAEIVKDQCLQ